MVQREKPSAVSGLSRLSQLQHLLWSPPAASSLRGQNPVPPVFVSGGVLLPPPWSLLQAIPCLVVFLLLLLSMMILRPASRGAWRALGFLGLILVLDSVGAWYKHVASPRYHTVGRASGLLMGVSRSPYLWRRALEEQLGQSSDTAPSLPANWLIQQRYPAETEPWTALEHPHLMSQVEEKVSRRAFVKQTSPRTRAVRNLLAVLHHQGLAQASRCPAGCQETPWQRSPLYPELLARTMRKKEQLGATQETRISRPAI